MYLTKKYKMKDWYGFDKYIFKASDKFYEKFKIKANIVVFNEHTYEQVCFVTSISPKRKCVIDDEGEETIELTGFQDFDKISMQCAICEYLKDKEFELVFNDENDDDDDDDDVNPFVSPEIEKDMLTILG